ncbi:hypothetical protein Pfo_009478, partial [Paulownia fortunei]
MEEDSTACDQIYSYITAVAERAFTSRHQPPASSSLQFHIKFSCKSLFSDWVIHQDSTEPQLLSWVNPPLIETFILVNLQQFLCYEKARETIGKELQDWPVWGEGRQKLIEFAVHQAREAVISMPASHNVVHLNFRVVAIHKHVFDERRASINWVIQRSMDVDEARMAPAAESSIESLESKKILKDSGTCPICMEEFFRGCEAVCMPCSHVFHGDCIKKWLRTSHYCPVCRFEMPTNHVCLQEKEFYL